LNHESLFEGMKGRVDERVLQAMMKVKRELFVPEKCKSMAYADMPLPIGHGQTISAPHMVAIMVQLLDLREGMKVLDIGTGSGYHAAIMAQLVGSTGYIYSVEIIPELVKMAGENLKVAGIENVTVIQGDGSLGLPEYAPYDRINVAASAPEVPKPLMDQLAKGGKMAVPVGSYYQELVLVTKEDGSTSQRLMAVAFVPLVGRFGHEG
jgi:protein-L-isoaspartate(D-aspartate) O-methyltransferase